MIDVKFPLNYTKNNGVTAVGIAAFRGNLKVLEMLYKAGADINVTSKEGAGPLYLAIKQDRIDCIKYLIERNAFVHLYDPSQAEFSPLFQSIKLANFAALECICDTGIDLDQLRDQNGYSPLTFAAFSNQDSILNYISLRVRNLDDEDPFEAHTVFVHYVLKNDFEMASKLLQRGSNLNYTNRDGKTPLSLAILLENDNAVKYLLGKGADPHYEDLIGKDSCDYAKES